jgi:hypothetical protein
MSVIKPSEHTFICGMNGTGKTVLAMVYLAGYQNVIVLDTKQTFNWQPFCIEGEDYILVRSYYDLINVTKYDKIVYRPNINENNIEYYEKFFEFCFKRRNTIIMIDEAMYVCNAHKMPFWYKACLTNGREIDVACWNLSQRPSEISSFLLTESTHWFVFRLNSIDDRIKLKKCSGDDVFLDRVQGHYFIYKNMKEEGTIKRILNFKGGFKK